MKNWFDIVAPHEDIRKGHFGEAVFAVDLGNVDAGRAGRGEAISVVAQKAVEYLDCPPCHGDSAGGAGSSVGGLPVVIESAPRMKD